MPSRKGSPNKFGATAKENVIAVFTRLGGTAEMAKWAKENQTEFYKLYARLIPQQIDIDANVRTCDVSSEPLTPEEWAARFGQNLVGAPGGPSTRPS